ncbi:hypothetical protein [Shewanella litoralis]|jgi:hypothetical protein|uniref:Uncharacterized protein n=1 Tax=Shewanella litoralis TaxID=2282700 RepID=A0ABQ2R4C3_9GAMM|nr:hypothetical protein [Shewanella litoralis]GGQ10534.1 hypothetical protein GCM10009411_09150 [Shewanella litoralis]
MKILTSLEQIKHLNHPETVKGALMAECLTPFGSFDAAEHFWHDYQTQLFAFMPEDNIELVLENVTDLTDSFECSEFITHLADNWYLALVITTQAGGGNYLLFQGGVHNALDKLLESYKYNGEHYEP